MAITASGDHPDINHISTEDMDDLDRLHEPDSDHQEAEVKGPDPAVWGDDSARPSAEGEPPAPPVDDEGNPMEVKGPDPAQWSSQ